MEVVKRTPVDVVDVAATLTARRSATMEIVEVALVDNMAAD